MEGVQKAEHLKPDLVLLDIGLPKLEGIDASRLIRKRSLESKIVFLTVEIDGVIDHQNPYFSERSPESEGDKIIIRAPGRPERSLLRARVTDHGCPPITPPG